MARKDPKVVVGKSEVHKENRTSVGQRIVAGFGFSLFLFVVWGVVTSLHVRKFIAKPEAMELLWIFYNAMISVLFLIRTRPSVVSMNPIHWLVALLTSFSGMFFKRLDAVPGALGTLGDGMILVGLGLSAWTAILLGRSYDFLPAVRVVKTASLYKIVRHPMYAASIMIRFGYLLKNISFYNVVVFTIMIVLYDRRAAYEELILGRDERYREYRQHVHYRFLTGVR